ncbi:MAG: hypothetical protein JOZ65_11130 [Chloroflexi bacterium]|nr:hypothetical protein [Chloroflexota bacterium]
MLLARAFRKADYIDTLAQVADHCPLLRQAIVLVDEWEQLLTDGRRPSPRDPVEVEGSLQFDDPISIQYTSGTTGFPMGPHALSPGDPVQRLLRRRNLALYRA